MSPEFTKTQITQKGGLGELLRSKRESLGYSVKEVELNTRIRSKYILAFEADDFEKLPDDVYIKGFLKNYSDFLGLEYQDVLALYNREKSIDLKVKKISIKVIKKQKTYKPRIVLTPRTLLVAGIITGFFAVASFIMWQFSLFAAPPELIIESPANNSEVTSEALVLSGKTTKGATLYVNDIQIQNADGDFKEKISLQDGPNVIRVMAINQLNKKSEKLITVVAKLPKLEITPIPIAFNGLEVKATAGEFPITLDLVVDDKEKVHQFLMPGTTQTFKAVDKMSFTTSNAKSTKIVISNEKMINKDLGFLMTPDKKVEGNAPVPKPEPKSIEFKKDLEVR
ncbi:TPA: hypothetical protein DDW69_04685 [candidate division CPR2 bacterium]|uniref:DUF4115 domain-containing protein n=1 Tax=candidate division CPR2 bacterium GW2011_GWC1_41_48 TaxID=1618344 RepID=A0A0G0YIH0_UNCC2|nr:MAG: hypothetical protein UT47_C0002G0185 [candidate division CPR2 bacterium GW2011_GWC2_39_35]KKR28545.1 MAG: hypothetical protein UT60_C0018G0015 [candidate division CPR2 bacterium GW2011_GWD2_39_7]KKS09341.1 MAG: hypothetical protein UU65_C0002G0119 [candidate division CPR2 bacterium GW2011_GWC1_41_48]OGB72817.1 MAG: hypothetical protein A2Y26_04880 [candidate division CPR2 bacterium GWD2_39_7]HBG82097.1 hypothetical protein [candidate division CPR2 bacterium]